MDETSDHPAIQPARSATPPRNVAVNITPFSPRRPAQRSHDEILASEAASLIPSTIVLAPGCELIVRGVGAKEKGCDVVDIIRKSTEEIKNAFPEFKSIPINIKKFNSRFGDWYSTCYIALAREFDPQGLTGLSSEPRVDLLNLWKTAL
ncbi:hypothetical protein HYPSUDRAFT_138523, partial [Hypholoma sublateritium FD-334 SS-4]